jgi:methylthioribose-1-phosphate isomerase
MTFPNFKTIEWIGGIDGHAALLDQTRLPTETVTIRCGDVESVRDAIRALKVRGAPAIGIAAGMGVVLGARRYTGRDPDEYLRCVDESCARLASARPTAVNLLYALDRMKACARRSIGDGIRATNQALLVEAKRMHDEDAAMCRAIGEAGVHLIEDGAGVMTVCNAGALATGGIGTALAPLYLAHDAGRRFTVFAPETRPLLQGARLTVWELRQAGIEVILLCDSAAASLMSRGGVDLIVTGADRIAANGDVANKIGTYSLAVLARAHDIPLYVAAPSSTFDFSCPGGGDIPIEERDPAEVCRFSGLQTAPEGTTCYTPAFDVTPARLIRGLLTERGLIEPVNAERIRQVLTIGPAR